LLQSRRHALSLQRFDDKTILALEFGQHLVDPAVFFEKPTRMVNQLTANTLLQQNLRILLILATRAIQEAEKAQSQQQLIVAWSFLTQLPFLLLHKRKKDSSVAAAFVQIFSGQLETLFTELTEQAKVPSSETFREHRRRQQQQQKEAQQQQHPPQHKPSNTNKTNNDKSNKSHPQTQTRSNTPSHHATTHSTTQHDTHPSHDDMTPQQVEDEQTARHLLSAFYATGNISAAANKIISPMKLADMRDSQIQDAVKLLLTTDDVTVDAEHLCKTVDNTPPLITSEHVKWAVDVLKTTSSGVTGWAPTHIKAMASTDQGLTAVTFVVNAIFARRVPSAVLNGWSKALAIPLMKPGNSTKVRPIMIADSWLRLMETCVTRDIPDLSNTFSPLQMAIGTSSGAQSIIHLTRTAITTQHDYVAVKTDLSNAYGSLHRRAIFDAVSSKCPAGTAELTKWFLNLHLARPSLYLVEGKPVQSYSRGVAQGGPMSMALFCLTVQPALVAAQQLMFTKHNSDGIVVALADDTTFLAPPQVAFDAVDLFTTLVAKVGLKLNPSKSATLCINTTTLSQATTLAKARSFPDPVQCLEILGSFVGTKALETKALEEQLNQDMFRRLQAIPDPQTKMLLLRYSIITTCTYLTRTMPPDVSANALLTLRKHVKNALQDIMGLQPADKPPDPPPPPQTEASNAQAQPQLRKRSTSVGNARKSNNNTSTTHAHSSTSSKPITNLSIELQRLASLSLGTGGLGLTDLHTIRHSAYYASVTHAIRTWSAHLSAQHPVISSWLDGSSRSSHLVQKALDEQKALCLAYNTSRIDPLPKQGHKETGDKADPEAFLASIIPPPLPQSITSIPSMNDSAVDKTQKILGRMHNAVLFRDAWRAIEVDNIPRRTQFLANTVPTSNLWLRNIPSNPKFRLDKFCFQFNLFQHFCLDNNIDQILGVNDKMHCCCSKDIVASDNSRANATRPATYGHFVNCTRQSAFTARHNLIVQVVADAVRAAGLNPQLEAMVNRPVATPSTGHNQMSQKRFDVTVAGADELLVIHTDISVTSSRQRDDAIAQGGAKRPLHAAKSKVQQKLNTYKNLTFLDTETLIPLVAETSGAIHPNFAKFFAALGNRVDNRPPLDAIWTTPTFATYWLAVTSMTLRRETARACQRLADAALNASNSADRGQSPPVAGSLDL
jgi:hypothetical protein